MKMKFGRMALVAIGFAFAPLTASPLQASLITDTVSLHIGGTGVGQPGNFNIDLNGTAVVGPETEFRFNFSNLELNADVGANEFEVRFVRRGSFGDLSGPVTWTLSGLDFIGSTDVIQSIIPLPPAYGSQLPVLSFRVIDGHTVEVVTGPTIRTANQNARFQFVTGPAPVPEPSTLAIGTLLACIGICGRLIVRSAETTPPLAG